MFTLFGKPFCKNQNAPCAPSDQNDSDFLNLPSDVIREILKRCDLISLLSLTKVCRALYHFIHRLPPTAIVKRMSVQVESDAVFIDIKYSTKLSFHYHENGCLIVNENYFKIYVEDEDFLSVACNHLRFCLQRIETITRFEIENRDSYYHWKFNFSFWERLKSSLFLFMNLSFQFPTFEEMRKTVWETIEECLESRRRPLRVTELIMKLEEPRINILNLLDPKPLGVLKIDGSGQYPEFNVKRLKNLEMLAIYRNGAYEKPCVSNPIRDFLHIRFVGLTVETISDEEVLEIKKKLMTCRRLRVIGIHVKQGGSSRDQLHRVFGPPQHPFDRQKWCFPVRTNGYVICQVPDDTMLFSYRRFLLLNG